MSSAFLYGVALGLVLSILIDLFQDELKRLVRRELASAVYAVRATKEEEETA